MCKSHYIDCLIKGLGIDKSLGNSTYTPKILDNHRSVVCSFGISTKNEELDLIGYIHLYICMHKCMYGYNYISRSAKYSMKSLSSWYLDPFYQQSKLDLLLGPSWLWLYGSWVFNYLCNQCLSLLKLWVRTPFMARCTRYNIMWSSWSVTCDRSGFS